jgi:hypothetical protein
MEVTGDHSRHEGGACHQENRRAFRLVPVSAVPALTPAPPLADDKRRVELESAKSGSALHLARLMRRDPAANLATLHVPGVVGDAGGVRHRAGVTDVPGLYLLGLPWQTCRGSALLGFVSADAATLADRMASDAGRAAAPCKPLAVDPSAHQAAVLGPAAVVQPHPWVAQQLAKDEPR